MIKKHLSSGDIKTSHLRFDLILLGKKKKGQSHIFSFTRSQEPPIPPFSVVCSPLAVRRSPLAACRSPLPTSTGTRAPGSPPLGGCPFPAGFDKFLAKRLYSNAHLCSLTFGRTPPCTHDTSRHSDSDAASVGNRLHLTTASTKTRCVPISIYCLVQSALVGEAFHSSPKKALAKTKSR